VLGWQPYVAEFPASAGKHTVAVRVISTPRNLFGPFHNRAKPRMRTWPAAWADFPERQPAGSDYDLLDYGLMAPPAIAVAVSLQSVAPRLSIGMTARKTGLKERPASKGDRKVKG